MPMPGLIHRSANRAERLGQRWLARHFRGRETFLSVCPRRGIVLARHLLAVLTVHTPAAKADRASGRSDSDLPGERFTVSAMRNRHELYLAGF